MADKKSPDNFTGLSLESSQRCNLNCPYCVLRTYEDRMDRGDMDMDVVRAVMPCLEGLESVDFTGWGEPLLNPRFEEIIKLVRSGFPGRMSFTTNGMLFNKRLIDACIEIELDIICFSVDAVDKGSYARMRPNGKFSTLMKVIKEFVSKKDKREKPGLYATYLLQRGNFKRAEEFVRMASALGMDGVVFQLMTGVYNEDGKAQVTYSNYYKTDFNEDELHEALERANKAAPSEFTIVIPEMVQPARVHNCGGFDITKPFVSARGDVTLCCAMAYPVELMGKHGKVSRTNQYFFGNVLDTPLPEIWSRPEYVAVRSEILRGASPEACGDCIGLYIKPPRGG